MQGGCAANSAPIAGAGPTLRTMRLPLITFVCTATAWLSACALPEQETELRVLVKLARPSGDRAAIARLVSDRAGVTARYLSATSPAWHALALPCSGATECDALLQRLRADRAAFDAAERDERKRIVTP